MKVMTIIGTRPEIIRLSLIIDKLDKTCDHVLVHTGQNYDKTLNDIFFDEMEIRKPDEVINSKSNSLGEQLAIIFKEIERILLKHKPDKVLILGDTNTSLCTVLVERLGFPVYHMEAGNRCFDLKVPEEKNRKVIDSISSFNLPYTPGSRENLIRESYPKYRIFESGNPINEVLNHYDDKIKSSSIHKQLDLLGRDYIVSTAHRAENVDNPKRLENIFEAFATIADETDLKIIFSCHPRTKNKLSDCNIEIHKNINIHEPFGFFDFINLQRLAICSITDSGTVQEESCLLHTPTVTIRDTTERPETVECGSNMVSGLEVGDIVRCFDIMSVSRKKWSYPIGYCVYDVSDRVVNFILSNQVKG